MRDIRPFDLYVIVDEAYVLIVSVVFADETKVHFVKLVAGQCIAFFRSFVDRQFEFGELRLAENRSLDAFEITSEEGESFPIVLDRLQHKIEQEGFVERRGDLGDKNGIMRRRIRLMPIGQITVHRVPHFMRERADVVVFALIVEQHVRVNVVRGAGGVRSRSFAFRGVHVDPSFAKRPLHDFRIVLTQRRKRPHDGLPGFVVRVSSGTFFDQRHIQVVIVQDVETEDSFAKFQIAMEGRQVFTDALDEPPDHRRRNVISIQRTFETGVVFPDFGVKNVFAYFPAELSAESPSIFVELAEKSLENVFTIVAFF